MNKALTKAQPGQSALLAAAIGLLVFLGIGGYVLSQSQNTSATLNIADNNRLKSYYYAQSGLQEAWGTRFVPTSNCLNFETNRSTQTSTPAFRKYSGWFDQNGEPSLPTASTGYQQGVYRYVVELPNNIDFTTPATKDSPITLKLYSEGAVCIDPETKNISSNATNSDISYSASQHDFSCKIYDKKSGNYLRAGTLIKTGFSNTIALKKTSGSTDQSQTNQLTASSPLTDTQFQTVWNNQCGRVDINQDGPKVIKYLINNKDPKSFSGNQTISVDKTSDTITLVFDKAINYDSLRKVGIFKSGTTNPNLNLTSNSGSILLKANAQFMETSNSATIYPSITDTSMSGSTYDVYLKPTPGDSTTGIRSYDGSQGSQIIKLKFK